MAAKQQERTPNFSPGEKECLFNLCIEHADILEDKKTNRTTIEQKNNVWKTIQAQFNNVAPILCYRNADQLRRLYENKKKELRKKMAEHKKETFLTGGGPLPDKKWDPIDEILLSIVNEKTVVGFRSSFDSDRDNEPIMKKRKSETITKPMVLELSNISILEDLDRDLDIINNEILDPPRDDSERDISSNHLNQPSCSGNQIQGNKSKQSGKLTYVQEKENVNPMTPHLSRRRPQTGVKILTSSDLSERYNVLLDRRLILIEKQTEQTSESVAFAREEHKQKMLLLKEQNEILILEKEEKKLKVELMRLDVASKRSILSSV